MDLWMKMVLCKLKVDTVIFIQSDRNCQNKRFQKVCFRKLEQTFFPFGKRGRTNPLLTRGFAFSCGKQGGLHVTDEIIIIATDNAMTVEELKETVCYVNRNELRQEEILSDNVYKFCRSDGNVEII